MMMMMDGVSNKGRDLGELCDKVDIDWLKLVITSNEQGLHGASDIKTSIIISKQYKLRYLRFLKSIIRKEESALY